MDIYELRRCIKIINYSSHPNGAVITYQKNNSQNLINLQRDDFIKELISISSIDEESPSEIHDTYIISQWDALNIVIRFELARQQEKEIDNSDIGAAINKITKPLI